MILYIIIPILLIFVMCYMGIVFYFSRRLLSIQQAENKLVAIKNNRISVVVAFRNEAENLPNLLEDLKHQTLPPEAFQIILVNDHSTDNWQTTILPFQLPNLQIINATHHGKKAAIRQASLLVTSPCMVTTDADCSVSSQWLETLLNCKDDAQLLIGPIEMTSDGSWFQNLQQLDYRALQLCSVGAALSDHPIMCSGANLLIETSAYHALSHDINDQYLSGDDMFLLHAAKRAKMKIGVATSSLAVVKTKAENNLNSFLRQRIRWASKSKGYSDAATIAVACIVLMANVAILTFLGASFFESSLWIQTFIVIGIKSIIEWMLFKSGRIIYPNVALATFISVMWIHPFYTVGVALAGFMMNVNWKERRVETKTPASN